MLEHGFAYGTGGDRLTGKAMMLAVTAAGPAEAYAQDGYQHFPLRTFLTPLEQTARLCKMDFLPPYVLFAALRAPGTEAFTAHISGYSQLLEALRDDRFDRHKAAEHDVLTADTLPLREEA